MVEENAIAHAVCLEKVAARTRAHAEETMHWACENRALITKGLVMNPGHRS